MVAGVDPTAVLGTVAVFLLATAAAYVFKACLGYLLWSTRESVAVDVPELDPLVDAPVKVYDDDRVTAARLSTRTPRWLVGSAAVESLSPPQLRCLVSHLRSHVRGGGRLVHNATIGLGFTLALLAPRAIGLRPGFLLAFGYVVVSLPVVDRWILYRADRLAAADRGVETYLSFLETAAHVEPPRPWWYGYLEPSPTRRARRLRDRVATEESGG